MNRSTLCASCLMHISQFTQTRVKKYRHTVCTGTRYHGINEAFKNHKKSRTRRCHVDVVTGILRTLCNQSH